MSDVRKLLALMCVAIALGAAAFGLVRGLSATGPAHGTRFVVTIDPPIDADVIAAAQKAAEQRLGHQRVPPRVIAANNGLVIETASTDPALGAADAALLEQTAKPAHAMHVVSREPFSRATGFLPRAWPFFAAAGVLLAIAGLVARRRRA